MSRRERRAVMGTAGRADRATDLGRRVRERRSRGGLSQEEAAARAGMSVSYLRYLESSPSARPTLDGLVRLADALGTTISDLLGAGPGTQPASAGRSLAPGHGTKVPPGLTSGPAARGPAAV